MSLNKITRFNFMPIYKPSYSLDISPGFSANIWDDKKIKCPMKTNHSSWWNTQPPGANNSVAGCGLPSAHSPGGRACRVSHNWSAASVRCGPCLILHFRLVPWGCGRLQLNFRLLVPNRCGNHLALHQVAVEAILIEGEIFKFTILYEFSYRTTIYFLKLKILLAHIYASNRVWIESP
jgi:hypothetical protein